MASMAASATAGSAPTSSVRCLHKARRGRCGGFQHESVDMAAEEGDGEGGFDGG